MTTLAALFAPLALCFLGPLCAFGLLFLRGKPRGAAVALALGCLAGCLGTGLFFLRLDSARTLVGTTQQVTGSVFYDGGQQMALARTPDGKRRLFLLFPPAEGLVLGDSFTGSVTISAATPNGDQPFLSGGVLLHAIPGAPDYRPDLPPPFPIQGMLLRKKIGDSLRALAPTPATNLAIAVLFSAKEHVSPALRAAFANSGMAHLLAVSGLHLSILVWTLVGAIQRVGGGRWAQILVGVGGSLFILFAAGMSPSVFRATLMTLLTLLAQFFSRRSDGLTSLTVAAVLLAAFSPPVITDLSFLLSFLSVWGILVLAPRLFTVLEQFWIARFSNCGPWPRRLLSAVSVSTAAQLATAPVVALTFGTLPVLGVAVNLIAIPLVYPVLLFGFATSLALAVLPAAAPLLLWVTDLFAALLGALARFTALLPGATLPVVFPSDLLPPLLLALAPLLAVLLAATGQLPRRVGLLRRVALGCVALSVLSATANAVLAYNSYTVASSSVTGTLMVAGREGTLVADTTQNDYHRGLDSDLLARLGSGPPQTLLLPHPYDAPSRQEAAILHYSDATPYTPNLLSSPLLLPPGVGVTVPQPYLTEITVGNTKVMKFYATYDRIEPFETDGDCLLVDRQGNLLSPGGKHYVFRRGNGESFTRIYR